MIKTYKLLPVLLLLSALLLNGQYVKETEGQKNSEFVIQEKSRAVSGVITNNAKIIIGTGSKVIVHGNYTSNSAATATLDGTGAINLTGDFINNNISINPLAASSTGPVVFNGTTEQTIGGTAASTTFYGITIDNSAGILLSKNAVTEKDLLLTAGKLNVQSNNFMFGINAVASGFDASKYIIATGSGTVSKKTGGAGSFTFPLAENTGAEEYSPLTFNFGSGTFANAVVSGNVVDAKHSSTSTTANLSRYWNISQSGITGFYCTLTGIYKDDDITGSEHHIWSGFYDGSTLTNYGKTNISTNTISSTVTSFGTNGAFTGNLGNSQPVITSTAITSAVKGTLYSYTLTATDVDDDAMTYSATVLPSWLTFNTTTRVLSGTPTQTELNVGSYSVTLRVNDGFGDTYQTFTIGITMVNAAPTISNISDTVTDEDVAKQISFTIGDIDNPVTGLTLSATSSNTALVPVANVVFGGSGANRTATITPVANQNGTSIITIMVSDGVSRSSLVFDNASTMETVNDSKRVISALSNGTRATSSDSFVLTVNSINDAPVCDTNPAISGSSYLGAIISGSNGTWSDIDLPTQGISYAYQWQRADNSDFTVNVVDIASATAINYTLTADDQSKYLRLKVTGKDNGTPNMSGTAVSNVMTITIPTLSGIKTVGIGGDYATINGTNGLFAAINGSIITGNITAKIVSNLAETSFTQLGQWSEAGTGNFRLRIIPDATTARTITGTQAALIVLWGADRVTLDGTKDKLLTFDNSNSSTSGVSPFMLFNSDNDSIINCTIRSVNPSSSYVKGISLIGSTGTVIAKNKIYSLSSGSTGDVTAIDFNTTASNMNVSNNMITLNPVTTGKVIGIEHGTNGATALNVYYNSIYIGGSQSGTNNSYAIGKTGSIANLSVKDNILYNARTNSAKAGSGKHYAIYITNTDGVVDCDYNLLYSAINYIGRLGSTDYTSLANWSYLSGGDDHSSSTALTFEDYTSGDLRYKRDVANNAVFDHGTPITGIADDYYSKSRTSMFYTQVDVGAYELPQSSDIDDGLRPIVTSLSQNYPNPFNPTTEIKFSLAKDSKVSLTVYNAKGEIVKTLLNTSLNAGFHSVNFNASGLNSGVYIYKMITRENSFTKKMIIVK